MAKALMEACKAFPWWPVVVSSGTISIQAPQIRDEAVSDFGRVFVLFCVSMKRWAISDSMSFTCHARHGLRTAFGAVGTSGSVDFCLCLRLFSFGLIDVTGSTNIRSYW